MDFSVEIIARGANLQRVREIYFSQDFGDAVAAATGLVERKQQEHRVQPNGTERTRTRVVPQLTLPGGVRKLLQGQVVRYDEVVEYDPRTQQASFSIRSVAGRTVQVNGTIHFLEEGDDVRLRFDGYAQIKVFGVGRMLERYLIGEVTTRYGQAQAVLQRFVDAAPRQL